MLALDINSKIEDKRRCINNYKDLIDHAEKSIDKFNDKYFSECGRIEQLFDNII